METNSKATEENILKEGEETKEDVFTSDSDKAKASIDNIDDVDKVIKHGVAEDISKEETESSDCTEDNSTENTDEKKGFFGKKKEKKDKKDIQIEELTDKLKRSMAEFDNYRKRTEKEKSRMYEIGAKDIVEIILPVIDNFERGLAAVPEGEKKDSFMEGMQMIYTQLMTTLEEAGVKTIEAVGNEFNPDFHNAVMHVEDEEYGENVVIEEFQKGYTYKESVVRHSMVKVAN